jgi:predicted ATPase
MARSAKHHTRRMRFTSVKLQSWKNFKSVDVPLAERVFVIGANASGKSNFLDVFRFLHDLVAEGGGLAKAVSIREGMSKIRSLHATSNSTVRIEVEMQDGGGTKWSYALAFDTPTRTSAVVEIKSEVVKCNDETVLARPSKDDVSDRERLRQTAIEQVSANKKFREIAEFFRSIRLMNLVPQLIREGQASPRQSPGEDPLGRDLLERIRACGRGRTGRLNEIGKVLSTVVPSFSDLDLDEDKLGRPHLVVKFKHWRKAGAEQQESQFSDGTLRLIAMLWALQEDAGPLLLEEPEWSLHTGILERLAAFIAQMQRKGHQRQVIITTHSERVLGDPGIATDEVLLLVQAAKGGTDVKHGPRVRLIDTQMRRGLTAAEAALPHTRIDTMNLFGAGA